ncbi:MAG: hypothetical protein WBD13_23670 [Burkholderiaceae bacterium]
MSARRRLRQRISLRWAASPGDGRLRQAQSHQFLLERLSDDYDRYGNRYGSFKDHKAGMQIAFHLNTQARDTVIAELATARGLAGKPLSSFSVGHESPNGLLLGFCGYNKDEMAKALATLKSTLSSNFV